MAVDYRQGDYRVVADRLRPAAEQLVQLAAPPAGGLVVDLAAGTGNVARACTARGASVVAVDRVQEQLVLGRGEPDPDIAWVCADALAVPLRDDSADAVLSTFGLIYVPDPDAALREAARVCRPGGTLGLTAWPDEGSQREFVSLLTEFTGEVMAHDHLATWGSAERLATRLASAADDVQVTTGELVVRAASVDAWWTGREASPPIASARAQLSPERYAELGERLRDVARRLGTESADGFTLLDPYLLAVGRVR